MTKEQIKNNEAHARALNINLEEFDELTSRMVGYLKKRPINTATVADSFFIYKEIVERAKEDIGKKWITSNQELREYGADIQQLRISGKSYEVIKKELNLKVNRQTIGKFCRDNEFNEGDING